MEKCNKRRREDLLEAELYELKVKKLKSQEEYENVVIFPFFEDESISSDVLGQSFTFEKEGKAEGKKYFTCDLCYASLEEILLIGECMNCRKKLGACCYYDNQWMDSLETVEFPDKSQFLCPKCISLSSEESFSFSFSGYESESYSSSVEFL